MLRTVYNPAAKYEAGLDEAGRGCLAGPVFAACVVLPKCIFIEELNDSKKLSPAKRYKLREIIEKEAIAYSVAYAMPSEIDELNILKASVLAMHRCLDKLSVIPDFLIIDGNYFIKYKNIQHKCIVKGDSKYASIAAASILAKTYRDDFMNEIHTKFPEYQWNKNKGYPTKAHVNAIMKYGYTFYHRRSFNVKSLQLKLS
ncbi:MAG: ribonuclease HII [Bacteroidales bacterium]|nr:ribonuclease HII [Bacteroidales bacterium]